MDSPIPPDPYKTLGIDKSAPLAAVRSAHRKLVLTCHPDKVTDESAKQAASDKFHQVQQAYEILSDETRRERYDERVKLAELRAQMMKERGGSRVIPDVELRGGPKRTHEMRDNTVYEYREPREPPPRSRAYEEESYFQPRYQEVRPSKKYDDHIFEPTPRRTSGRASDDKRRARDLEDEREIRRERARAEDKARAEKTRKRDQNKRKDTEYKSSRRQFASVHDEDSDSDSTETFVRPKWEEPLKKRHEDDRRREREDTPRRSTKRDSYDDYIDDKHLRAKDYIEQTRGSVEPEPRRLNRAYSYVDRPPAPPLAPPALSRVDTSPRLDTTPRRSSARDSRRREQSPLSLPKKDRRVTEIVDPAPEPRRPKLPAFSSDPKGLKVPKPPISSKKEREPLRSATLDYIPESRQPTMRRSETMPSSSRRSDNVPLKPSKLKEQHDSGYSSRSSRGTPDLSPAPSPQMTSTRYRYNSDSEDEITIVPEPEESFRRSRGASPPKSRRDRPSMPEREATSTRGTPMRAASYVFPIDQIHSPKPPPFPRTESGKLPPFKERPSRGPPLYGEVSPIPGGHPISESPRYRKEDIQYTDYPRRGSTDDRDRYSPSHHRPELSRHSSRPVRA